MAKTGCIIAPIVNNEFSIMYRELNEKITKDRQLANFIYAAYSQQGVAAMMDSQGYLRNKQGEHDARDVYNFFDVKTMQKEGIDVNLNNIAKREGAKDSLLNLVDFTSAEDALKVAEKINSNYKGVTGYVTQHGDKFNVNVVKRNSLTQHLAALTREKQQIWDAISQTFNAVGVDLSNPSMQSTLMNAYNGDTFLNWMTNIRVTRNSLIPKSDLKTLLQISENTQQVTRLKQMYGTLDGIAQAIYDAYRNQTTATMAQRQLMDATITNSKNFMGIDIAALNQQVSNIKQGTSQSPEMLIKDTLQLLQDNYGIETADVLLRSDKIKSLEDAAKQAAVTLNRQLEQLKLQKEDINNQLSNPSGRAKNIERSLLTLMQEIKSNKYYAGILGFLGEANNQFLYIKDLLDNIPQHGDMLEQSIATGKVLQEVKNIIDGYYFIVASLADVNKLITTEKISDTEKQNIATQASAILNTYNLYKEKINDLKSGTVLNFAQATLGEALGEDIDVANLIDMAQKDSTIFDRLYAMGRVSNYMIAAMGQVIEDRRTKMMLHLKDVSTRIRREENKLREAGITSEFMYEDNGRIISDIDWDKYLAERSKEKKKLIFKGVKGLALTDALNQWEEAHTEDRVVDNVSGRTERVPDSNYRKAFPALTPVQVEYYKNMMQLKGELGTLLPKYAQRQYTPPQVRRSFIDAWKANWKKGDLKGLLKAIKNVIKDAVTIREDDDFYGRNGIIEGEDVKITTANLNNTPLRQIPIFYINKVKDKDELLKDFSGALQHLAGTAIKYNYMYQIKDAMEFIGDFIKEKDAAAVVDNKDLVDLVSAYGVRIFKQLRKDGHNTNTSAIIDGFIDKFFYGVNIQDPSKWTKALQSLITWTSIKALTVNVKGMIANYAVGKLQLIIEAAGDIIDTSDLMWADAKVFGDNTFGAVGRIVDFVTNNVNSKSVLLAQRFDPLVENYEELAHQRYHRGVLTHLLARDYRFIGYGAGEHMLHFTGMYAVLHHEKIKINGEEASLYDAFSVGNKKDGNSELIINPNATYTNEEGQDVPIDDTYLNKVKDKIKYLNQTCHGSMDEASRGVVSQYMLGRFALNLRNWMVEHYSRRYRGKHYDYTMKQEREGYWYTVKNFMFTLASDIFKFEREAKLHWKDMSPMQKSNIRRAQRELEMFATLLIAGFAMGEPNDWKRNMWMRMLLYQTKRAELEVRASIPVGTVLEMQTMINKPFAATNAWKSLLYPVFGLGDIGITIKSGRHAGENKYLRNVAKYTIPFWSQFEELYYMDIDDSVYGIFDNEFMQR